MQEGKKKTGVIVIIVAMVIVAALMIWGIVKGKGSAPEAESGTTEGNVQEENVAEEGTAEEMAITAMYVPVAEDFYVFIGEQSGVFTIEFPEEIYDINGNKISKEQLVKGNMVKIYGNGIMLESYPGQYPGVTKLEVVSEGKPEDADKHQEIIDGIYTEPDPAEPPYMDVQYTTESAITTSVVARGGYEWTYMDKDGLSNAVVADSTHVLQWGDQLIDIKLQESLTMTLLFSKQPQEVKAVRYDASLLGTEGDMPEGEEVEIGEAEGNYTIANVESGYVYEITGIWENGRVTYGFVTVS